MRRSALAMVAWLGAASALAFTACGDNDPTRPDDAGGGFAGEAAGGADPGTGGARGGSSSGRGGNAGSDGSGGARGGDGGEPSSGGGGTTATGGSSTTTGGRGGADGGMGGEGGAGTAGDGGAAGAEPPLPPICDRILPLQRQLRADRVAQGTDVAVFGDCRLSWLRSLFTPPIDERHIYLNEVARLTMVLWGCRNEAPAGFKLAYGTVSLSSEEVSALVIHYLAAMRLEIDISDAEARRIESELERLAEPRIDPNLDGFSRSTCPGDGTGGEGGATGAGSMTEGG